MVTKKIQNTQKILFETGLLYERLYNDYFRGACYLYLSTLLDKDNEMIEGQYIRLCKCEYPSGGLSSFKPPLGRIVI